MTAAVRPDAFVRTNPPRTAEELLAWPDDDPGEIVHGVFIPKYPDGLVTGSGGEHGIVATEIGFLLRLHIGDEDLGEVVAAETGFRLRRDPDLVRCPDVAFVVARRLADAVPRGVIEGAPDLAVEVLSPTNQAAEMGRKVADYLAAGSRAVWVVDPDARTVAVHRPGVRSRPHEGDDVPDGGDVLPGFRMATQRIFARLATRAPR